MSSSNFHCTCCNLSFSRKTNLQRHLKTESHINRQNNLCLEQKIKLLEERLESIEKMLLKNESKDIAQSSIESILFFFKKLKISFCFLKLRNIFGKITPTVFLLINFLICDKSISNVSSCTSQKDTLKFFA